MATSCEELTHWKRLKLPYVQSGNTAHISRVSYFEQLQDYFTGFLKGQQKYNNHFI